MIRHTKRRFASSASLPRNHPHRTLYPCGGDAQADAACPDKKHDADVGQAGVWANSTVAAGNISTRLLERILEQAAAIVLAERRISTLRDDLRRGYDTELRVGLQPGAKPSRPSPARCQFYP